MLASKVMLFKDVHPEKAYSPTIVHDGKLKSLNEVQFPKARPLIVSTSLACTL